MDKAQVITDAQLLAEYAKKFGEEPAPVVETQAPSASLVTLLAGVEINGQTVTEAEVRELNGSDEEAIAKSGGLGKSLNTILQRGVVRLGDSPATPELLDQMLSGDRDLLMLKIRGITFGDEVEFEMTCPRCATRVPVELNLEDDVPVRAFSGEWFMDIKTGVGIVRVTLPTGSLQRKLMEALDITAAEMSTLMLSGCIVSVDGAPVIPSRVALEMGIGDRERVLRSILDNSPGPRLLEVTTACKACGETVSTPLSLASLFRL